MKKFKIIISTLSFFALSGLNVVHADGVGSFQFPNPSKYETLEDIINAVLSLIQPLFIVTFAAMILYGAWTWLTSQGDAEKIGRARKIIIAAIIGFTIAVIAPSIASIVGGFIGVKGLN